MKVLSLKAPRNIYNTTNCFVEGCEMTYSPTYVACAEGCTLLRTTSSGAEISGFSNQLSTLFDPNLIAHRDFQTLSSPELASLRFQLLNSGSCCNESVNGNN